jgi:hypothetical protein
MRAILNLLRRTRRSGAERGQASKVGTTWPRPLPEREAPISS